MEAGLSHVSMLVADGKIIETYRCLAISSDIHWLGDLDTGSKVRVMKLSG